MFSNEVLIEKSDKDRLIELLSEANAILEKYPYQIYDGSDTDTNISNVKSFTKKAAKYCEYLYIKE